MPGLVGLLLFAVDMRHRRCLLLFAAAPLLVNARALPEAQQVLDATDALVAKVAALEVRYAELEARNAGRGMQGGMQGVSLRSWVTTSPE